MAPSARRVSRVASRLPGTTRLRFALHGGQRLLCQGKNDFEAVEGVRNDLFFRQALGIGRVPSSARLRQRFDEQAEALTEAADETASCHC